ncbi:MAG: hypothetical protein HYU46_10470 [Deltaproteobacteria bacterium]|nr:hypothetical protein [Deltaproteobacteria bacterium]
MQVNFKLKDAIARKFGSQICGARRLEIHESKLSRIVHGWDRPSPALLEKPEKELGRSAVKNLKASSGDAR